MVNNPNLYCKFLVPSEQVVDSVSKAIPAFKDVKKQIWPVGVETKKWSPGKLRLQKKDTLLLYIKGSISEEDKEIISHLKSKNMRVELIQYGMYEPMEYRSKLRRARAVVWFGAWESQGIAMLEAWSCDVPTFVRASCDCSEPAYHLCKSIIKYSPYLDSKCGFFFRTEKELQVLLKSFIEISGDSSSFSPRAWVKGNLETKKQLFKLLNL